MTKLIDSLCVAKDATKVRTRKPFKVVDSVLAIDQNKLNDIRSFIDDNPDAGTREVFEEAYYIVTGSDYDSDKSKYATWLEDFDVMALRRLWPNGDEYESEVVYIPDNGTDQVAIPSTLTDGPESLMIVPKELVDALGFDAFMELQPGFYYVDSISSDIEDIGESLDDLKAWVRDLESFRDRDGYYKGITAKMAWEPVTKLFKGASKKPRKTDSVDDEYRQFDRFNDLREEVSDKEIVDVLPSYMGGYEINKFVDKVRNFYGLDQNPDEEIEDSAKQGITDSVTKFKVNPKDAEAVRKSFEEAGTPLKESNAWFYAEAPKEKVVELLQDYEYEIEDSTSKVSDAFIPLDPDRLKPNRDDFRKMGTLCRLIRDFDLDKWDLSKALRTLKQLYDKAKSSGGSDTREEEVIFEDAYRTLKDHGWLDKEPSQVSDAAYNPKFEKLRRVLSDTTIVDELSHYMSSDELEEFTETLTRNYDIDLEEVEDSAK